MLYDMHVHTRFSHDGLSNMQEYCDKALQAGVDAICFTEHIDSDPNDPMHDYCDIDAYLAAFFDLKKRYEGKVKLMVGIEFTEPQFFGKQLAAMKSYPFDMVMGSAHYWLDDMFPSEMIEKQIPAQKSYNAYWDAVEAVVTAGGFMVLGHVDFPKRYYKGYSNFVVDEPF